MIAAAALALVLVADDAPISLSAQVLARGSRDPVASASVTVDGAPAGETDGSGAWTVPLPPGRHTIQVQSPGHEPLTRVVEVMPGLPPLVLRLEPRRDGEAYETVVRSAPAEGSAVPLDREELTRTPGALGDPFRTIESLPGVTPVLWPLPIYAVRGANPGNTGFFVDGLRVPALFHFALGPAVIHPYFLDALDFYPGGYPARYGRYTAGIVATSTAAPPADRPRGSADLRLYDVGGLVSTPIDGGRGTVTVAGRYGYPGALLTALQEDLSVSYWDYQLRAEHALGDGRLVLFAFGSYDALTPKDGAPEREIATAHDRAELTFHRLDLRWRGPVGRGRLAVAAAGGFDETVTPFDETSLRARSWSLTPRLEYQRPLGAVDLDVGADAELTRYQPRIDNPNPVLADFTRTRAVALVGTYGSVVMRVGDRLVLTPGLRLDVYRESDVQRADLGPRLYARLRLTEATWLKVSGGRFSQMPSLPLQLPAYDGFGLARHGLQSSWQGSAGIEALLAGSLALETTAFVQRAVLTDIRDPDLGDPLLDDFLIRRDALAYGAELLLRRPPSARLHGWLSYALTRSLRAYEGGVVGDSDWDQRHTLNLVLGYRLGRYTIGGRFHLHTGRPVKIDGTTPPDFARLPPFYQLDLRGDRRFVFDRFVMDVYLELVNSTLTREVTALRQTERGVEGEGFSLVLPSLGVRAEF